MSEEKKSDIAKREEEILAFWKKNSIFEKSVDKHAPKGEFVFYDGPPFATGLPHQGSLLSSVIKDVVPRYKTMRGYRVPRRWGWDCHGLPIESLIEKKLGLKTKKDIEKIGVARFNSEARKSVLEFADEWEKYIDRVGRWVDFRNSYKTMDSSYIESVWWALKELYGKGLLYEGRKVLMYCPHCETPLAKAEIAMDQTYQDIAEEAVTVKFKVRNPEKHGLPSNTYLLAWTTTPWTLPGNVALAVGENVNYVAVERGGEVHLLASARHESGDLVRKEVSGKELVGIGYEPLYTIPAVEAHKGKKHVVLAADFVSTEEGTGIVHTAVMYGEDDFALGQKEKLPMVQLLDAGAHYTHEAPEFLRGAYIKDAENVIKSDLEKRGLLFARGMHAHSYPHCYRCGTPLIYNAVSSWFINIQKAKRKMLAENEKITWVPDHLKHGRFKHIVESAPDWTISRNRYWASPLPIWKDRKGRQYVFGSVDELLLHVPRSGNRYFLMRHGEAESNVAGVVRSGDGGNPLTQRGKEETHRAAEEIAGKEIDLIVASPVSRTQETAEIVRRELGLPENALMFDERLREIEFGSMDGRTITEWRAQFPRFGDRFTLNPHGGETYRDVRKRMADFLFEIERRYVGKRVLIVTHGDPAWLLSHVARRTPVAELCCLEERGGEYLETGEWHELDFVPYPHNEEYELDLHRPYIDELKVRVGEEELRRIPEVVDCWVESGAMPFASEHYLGKPLAHFNPRKGLFSRRKRFPGDFIAEYIAQTRTWFYYMHALGVLLFGSRAFTTVVSTGTILAADGSKMSKSKGNYTDPLIIMDQFGADALRFYLMGSVVMQSEDFNFKDEEVREVHNRVLGILWNAYKFYELYRGSERAGVDPRGSTHALDRWVFARLDETTLSMTLALDAYDTPRACRALRTFIDDYSTWYVRRSRDRVKGETDDSRFALATQRLVLETVARLAAPLMPFIAEAIYRSVSGSEESVHLSPWPEGLRPDTEVLARMQIVRDVVSSALEKRSAAGIKVRQPLALLETGALELAGKDELLALIADEVNVKRVSVTEALAEREVRLDTTVTPELREEGLVREIVRSVQDARKREGLSVSDRPRTHVAASPEAARMIKQHKDQIVESAGLASLEVEAREGQEVSVSFSGEHSPGE